MKAVTLSLLQLPLLLSGAFAAPPMNYDMQESSSVAPAEPSSSPEVMMMPMEDDDAIIEKRQTVNHNGNIGGFGGLGDLSGLEGLTGLSGLEGILAGLNGGHGSATGGGSGTTGAGTGTSGGTTVPTGGAVGGTTGTAGGVLGGAGTTSITELQNLTSTVLSIINSIHGTINTSGVDPSTLIPILEAQLASLNKTLGGLGGLTAVIAGAASSATSTISNTTNVASGAGILQLLGVLLNNVSDLVGKFLGTGPLASLGAPALQPITGILGSIVGTLLGALPIGVLN